MSEAQALWRLGMLPAEDLPSVASRALEEGFDGQALRELAGLRKPTWRDIGARFERAMVEVGLPGITRSEAGKRIARAICADVVAGSMSPYCGARKIWCDVWEETDRPDEFTVFVGLASSYEDDPKHRQEYAEEIIREAKRLISTEA